jgi:hypothetical protein
VPAFIYDKLTTPTYAVDPAAVHHLMSSWDLNTGAGHLYIDGASPALDTNINTNASIDWGGVKEVTLGAQETPYANKWNGSIGELYFHDAYIDLSVAANREKFYNSTTGKPANLGPDGSTPLLVQPRLYVRGPAGTLATNLGSGGSFTLTGALGDGACLAAHQPPDGITGYFLGDFVSATDAASYNLGTINVPYDGMVVVAVVGRGAAASVSGITVGGNAATLAFKQSGDQATIREIWYRPKVAAGPRAIVVNISTTIDRFAAYVYLIAGHNNDTPVDANQDNNNTATSVALSFTYSTGGIGIFAASAVMTGGLIWTNADEKAEHVVEALSSFGSAMRQHAGAGAAVNVTVAGTASGNHCLVGAMWR